MHVELTYSDFSIQIFCNVGLGDTENVPCDNCNKRQCDYCSNIAVKWNIYYNKIICHHPTYVPLVKTMKIVIH